MYWIVVFELKTKKIIGKIPLLLNEKNFDLFKKNFHIITRLAGING